MPVHRILVNYALIIFPLGMQYTQGAAECIINKQEIHVATVYAKI
jgi:hypothetical protein